MIFSPCDEWPGVVVVGIVGDVYVPLTVVDVALGDGHLVIYKHALDEGVQLV